MRTLPLLLSLCACGRIGYESQETPAEGDARPPVDAALPLEPDAAQLATGPFEAPGLIVELSGAGSADDPSLTGDMLELYFKSSEAGPTGEDIYRTTRASAADAWSAPEKVAELNSMASDDTPEVSLDGLTMLLSSNRDGNIDVYQAIRDSRDQAWSVPVRVEELSSTDADYAAAMDGSKTYLIMTRIIAGNLELYESRRTDASAPWASPTPLSELNTARYEADAVVDERGLQLYYTGTPLGDENNREVYRAERADPGDTFSEGVPVAELNGPGLDEDPWISPDRTTIFFVRDDGAGKQLYTAFRPL